MCLRLLLLVGGLLLGPCWNAALAGPTGQAATPVVSAHRGGAAYAPENTMLAFRNAVRLGVDELETDVQLTRDGQLVLLHDDTLDRTTNCTGALADHSWAEVARCDAGYWWSPGPSQTVRAAHAPHPLRGTGVRLPRLADLLGYVRGLGSRAPRLSIEIKDIPGEANFDPVGTTVATALVTALQRSGVPHDRLLVQSFFPTPLETVQRLDPRLRTQFLTSSPTGQPALAGLAYVTARGHDVMAPDSTAPDLTAQVVAAAHTAGRQVFTYTPDTERALRAARVLGVDGLITNRPACLLRLLGRPVPARLGPVGGVTACEGDRTTTGLADRPGMQYPQQLGNVSTCAQFRPRRGCAAPSP